MKAPPQRTVLAVTVVMLAGVADLHCLRSVQEAASATGGRAAAGSSASRSSAGVGTGGAGGWVVVEPASPLGLGTFSGCLFWNGALSCWGDNTFGELGDGETDKNPHYLPEPAGSGRAFAAITVGGIHMCGLDAQGIAYCWGGNDENQCGPGCSATPTAMFTDHRFVTLSAGRFHTCGIDATGTAYCWGSNQNGGLGTTSDWDLTFNQVAGGPFKSIRAGQDNTCALTTTGTVYCWGIDTFGVLGNTGDSEPCLNGCGSGGQGVGGSGGVYPPAPVTTTAPGPATFTSICVAPWNACAIDAASAGWCWGYNADGQLSVGDSYGDGLVPQPFQLPSGVLIQQMVCDDPICALSTTGEVYCAGSNQYGSLGLGTADNNPHPKPTLVPGLPGIIDLAGNNSSICALTSDGERYCWGANGGHLGDGTVTNRYSPELTP